MFLCTKNRASVCGLSLAGSAGEAAEPGHQETGGQQEGAARIQAGQCHCRRGNNH